MDKIEVLKLSALFKSLPLSHLEMIAPKCEWVKLPGGTLIFDDGSNEANGMYVIGKGNIKIFKNLLEDTQKQQAIAVLREGSFFGEMALLDEEIRSAGASTVDDSELLFLSKESFNELLGQNLEIAHQLLIQISRVMSKRLRDTNNLFREVVGWGYRARKEVQDLKSNFLSTISHELRTPIHSIQGFTNLMKDSGDIDVETQQRFIDVILHESKRLGDLINDLIALAEIEYGSIIIERQETNLRDLVENVYQQFKSLAEEKKLDYRLNISPHVKMVHIDINRMIQAVEHLVDNAIKFTPVGGTVGVDLVQNDHSIDILIKDTGCGVPKEFKEKIFDKFYQVDQSSTRKHQGAGIGLSLALHIIRLHGGTIGLESKENIGSTFTISLPKDRILAKS